LWQLGDGYPARLKFQNHSDKRLKVQKVPWQSEQACTHSS